MTANTHRVGREQWAKWNDIARRTFNDVYEIMRDNQHMYLHPKTEQVPRRQWSTTAWNAGWQAADAVMRATHAKIDELRLRRKAA